MCGRYIVHAPLLNVDEKVWTVAMMFVVEFFVLVGFSPDCDLINGYKMAFQQMQQSVIMVIAALTATDRITAAEGSAALVMFGTVQVILAMPEQVSCPHVHSRPRALVKALTKNNPLQIWGLVKSQVLKTADKVLPPDFAMTASELELKEELAVGFQKKLRAAKDIFGKAHNGHLDKIAPLANLTHLDATQERCWQ